MVDRSSLALTSTDLGTSHSTPPAECFVAWLLSTTSPRNLKRSTCNLHTQAWCLSQLTNTARGDREVTAKTATRHDHSSHFAEAWFTSVAFVPLWTSTKTEVPRMFYSILIRDDKTYQAILDVFPELYQLRSGASYLRVSVDDRFILVDAASGSGMWEHGGASSIYQRRRRSGSSATIFPILLYLHGSRSRTWGVKTCQSGTTSRQLEVSGRASGSHIQFLSVKISPVQASFFAPQIAVEWPPTSRFYLRSRGSYPEGSV